MKIVCVAGGSYKSFYLNHFGRGQSGRFGKLSRCDLLIFNYGIIYDYNTFNELMGDAIVTKELMNLSQALHCVVVAGVYVVGAERVKSIIVCNGDKIQLDKTAFGARLHIKNQTFIVGDEDTDYKKANKIILCNKRIEPNLAHCSKRKIYIFCDKFGVNFVQNQKMIRKFNKYSKFILK